MIAGRPHRGPGELPCGHLLRLRLGFVAVPIAVPDDVAVVGFDDIRMAEVASPALTTVRYEYPDVAAAALTALQDLLNRSSPVQHPLLVATRLVERQTS